MKLPLGWMAGALSVCVAVGAAQADVSYVSLNAPNPSFTGETVITGIRGSSGTTDDVVITGSYLPGSGTDTDPIIYSGSLSAQNGTWTVLTPDFSDPNISVTSSTLYGPNTAYYNLDPLNTNGTNIAAGAIRAVGSFKYSQSTTPNADHGMIYNGPTTGIGGTWTQIDAPSAIVSGETVVNTIAHSTMGSLVVGNYDTSSTGGLITGRAFIFNLTTSTWTNLNPTVTIANPSGAASVTAYGIWQNTSNAVTGDTYTIAGGYSDLNRAGLDAGYLVDYNSKTGELTNFKTFQFNDQPVGSLISHIDGITGTATGYSITGDHLTAGDADSQLGFFATITRKEDGSFNDAVWTAIDVPGEGITSGNTVYENSALGVATTPGGVSSSYVATVPEPQTWALLALGLGAIGFMARSRRRAIVPISA